MSRITIVFFDAGGGHRNAAEAIRSTLEQQRGWEVSLLNIQELLDHVDIVRRLSGLRLQDAYNLILRRGWTRYSRQLLRGLHALLRLYHHPTVGCLENYWREHPADIVLSVIPHFNRALAESLRRAQPSAAFATLLTDLADFPPHFWMEPQSQYLICGTPRARRQAIEMGHAEANIFEASGMVMKPKFYSLPEIDRVAERARLGLKADLPAAVVLFGGHGSGAMLEIATRLQHSSLPLQLMFLCGHSERIAGKLRRMRFRHPVIVEGFTREVERYMALADFFIGKPGPGSISEALQFHLPLIVECNARTLPQERYNTQWVVENGLGIVLSSFRDIVGGVQQLLDPATYARLRRNAGNYSNHALLELPAILEKVLGQRESAATRLQEGTAAHGDFGDSVLWAGLT